MFASPDGLPVAAVIAFEVLEVEAGAQERVPPLPQPILTDPLLDLVPDAEEQGVRELLRAHAFQLAAQLHRVVRDSDRHDDRSREGARVLAPL